ncbi:regulator of sigma D [Methylomarinovum caldicuralii]|uniref:Regulator of sigma D n=1 Tax=Methylomarinovum caldicuralii TaxID=438856 RepID=A0AAU9BXW1_9GAMM|nr:Rsd/AlgQ family anti-sigma factor [Methylomarinovum caldicuralii]BCX80867.1 regulator of sigma D [Methylomarinovum caldicuralii]
MTQNPVSGNERRLQTSHIIEELLAERRQMWQLYWELAEMKPFDKHKEPLEQILDRFCQVMIDYISLGHFGVYRRIIEGTERRQRVLEAAEKYYPAIAEATEVALKFNDQYENAHLTDHDVLHQALSELGEALATRIELEDKLLSAMRR